MKLRSLRAILAGFFAVAVLSLGTDGIFHATGVFPPMGQPMSDTFFGLATAYRILYTILGGYLTARLAPNRPGKHVLILTLVGTATATIGAVSTWDKGPEFGPIWYPVALIITAPVTLLGGKLAHGSHKN